MARIESGVDPEQYRFIAHEGESGAIREGLVGLGVKPHNLELYNIHESPHVDPGTVLVLDIFEIHRN